MQVNNRTYDFKDLIVSNQRGSAPPAPSVSPHYLGLTIGESDVFDSGLVTLASIKSNPRTPYLNNIAIGTDDTPLDPATQTGLIAQVYFGPTTLFEPVIPLTTAKATQVVQIYIPAASCTYHIKEIGIFNYSTLFCRQLFDFDNSVNPVNLIINWLLSFTTP